MNYVPSYVVSAGGGKDNARKHYSDHANFRKTESNKKIACLVNRYPSERGNLAIIKAK